MLPLKITFCPYCRGRLIPIEESINDAEPTECGEIETQDVEMVDAKEVSQ